MDGFDQLIRAAAPEVPDCGPSRRMSLLLLHQQMERDRRRPRRWMRWGSSVAAGLALVITMVGASGELGSDGFDLESQVETEGGHDWYSKTVGDFSINAKTADRAKELIEITESRQFTLYKLLGTSVGEDTYWQSMAITADGQRLGVRHDVFGIPFPETMKRIDEFQGDPIYVELVRESKRRPADYTQTAMIERYEVEIRTWVFQTARFGTVRLHEAYPLREYRPNS